MSATFTGMIGFTLLKILCQAMCLIGSENMVRVCAAEQRESLLAFSRTHFACFDAYKKLWLSARALSLMQRMLLYAKDELEMSTIRLQLRAGGEQVKPQEALYKLHPAEVPVKNVVSSPS